MGVEEQGIKPDRYMLIPRVLIFIFKESKVLLLKGAPNKRIWANLYNGVGGHVEKGEDVYQAALRELREETGLTANDLRLVGTLIVDASEKIGVGLYIFKGEYQCGDIQPSSEGTLEWVETERVDQLPTVQDLKILLQKITTMKPDEQPFFARSYYDAEGHLQVEINLS